MVHGAVRDDAAIVGQPLHLLRQLGERDVPSPRHLTTCNVRRAAHVDDYRGQRGGLLPGTKLRCLDEGANDRLGFARHRSEQHRQLVGKRRRVVPPQVLLHLLQRPEETVGLHRAPPRIARPIAEGVAGREQHVGASAHSRQQSAPARCTFSPRSPQARPTTACSARSCTAPKSTLRGGVSARWEYPVRSTV
jgi:hypothetical protein